MDSETLNALTAAASVVVGGLISFYVTVVMSRRGRFGELVRELGRERQYYEGYPTGPRDLQRALPKAIAFWRTVERIQWDLQADGHLCAASDVDRLRQFAYWAASHVELLKVRFDKSALEPLYLERFQADYIHNYDSQEFTQFERQLRPNYWALLRPYPHPNIPLKAVTVVTGFPERASYKHGEAIEISQSVIACDGVSSPAGHPRVYLSVTELGVACPYCDRKYVRRGEGA